MNSIKFADYPHIIQNKGGRYKKELEIEVVETFQQFKWYVLDSYSKDYLTEDKKLTHLCSFVERYFQEFSLDNDYQIGRRHLRELFGEVMKDDLQNYQPAFWLLVEKYVG